jgi:signal transduction histidine kinase
MRETSQTSIEPGLLQTFRLLTGLRATFAASLLLISWLVPGRSEERAILGNLVEPGCLLLYLSWPWLQRRLGKLYLPIAIIISTLGPMVMEYSVFRVPMEVDLLLRAVYISPLLLTLPLLMALVVVSWQYKFHIVAIFCISTALGEFVFNSMFTPQLGRSLAYLIASIFSRTMILGTVGYMITKMMAEQRRQREELAHANRQLVYHASTLEHLAASRERNRLARELHDTLAHTLSGVSVQLEAISAAWDVDPSKSRSLLEQARAAIRAGLSDTRHALKALRAAPLEDLGLALAIRQLAQSAALRANFNLDLDVQEHISDLNADVEQAVYRIAQEALTNVASHARASRVSLRLRQGNGRLDLIIQDNGQGFDLKDTARNDHHLGLVGMQERADLVKGHLELTSKIGEGTCVHLSMEIADDQGSSV